MKKTGIYKITNIVNGKIYVGSAVNIHRRWLEHKSFLNRSKHHSKYLQNSFNKYGIDNLNFEIIEECSKELLIEREQYWINLLDSYNNGYNCSPTAGNTLGVKHSNETRLKRSILNLGNDFHKGKKHSEETKKFMSEKFINKTYEDRYGIEKSNEIKNKMSENRKGENNPAYGRRGLVTHGFSGKTHTNDVKLKLKEVNKNNKYAKGVKILELDKNENIINQWDTIISCIKELNISRKIFNKILKEHNKSYNHILIRG